MRLYRQWLHGRTCLTCCFLAVMAAACATGGRGGDDHLATFWSTKMQLALGGSSAFEAIRFLRFDYIGERDGKVVARRTHFMDFKTGRCRVEERTDPENTRIICFNVKTKELYTYSKPMSADAAKKAMATAKTGEVAEIDTSKVVEDALKDQISDTFWLMSPTMLDAPGTHLKYAGEEVIENAPSPTLELDIDPGTNIAPHDRYSYQLDAAHARPLAWSFKENETDAAPTRYFWTAWQLVGKALLPVRFETADKKSVVHLDLVAAPGEIEDVVFTHP